MREVVKLFSESNYSRKGRNVPLLTRNNISENFLECSMKYNIAPVVVRLSPQRGVLVFSNYSCKDCSQLDDLNEGKGD
jgi:hypothetical protein